MGLVRSDISGHEKEADHPNGVLYFHEIQEHAIFSILYNLQPAIRMVSPSLHSTKTLRAAPAKNRLCQVSAWQTPPNCRRFHDNLYQINFSGCSALHESRRQSLPHPYSPLRAPAFFRINRNRVQANNPYLNKSFGMNMVGRIALWKNSNQNLKFLFFWDILPLHTLFFGHTLTTEATPSDTMPRR